MGWKGTVRSLAAVARAAEREAQRQHKADLKEEMIADAEEATDSWEEYVDSLISVHVDLADAINWVDIAGTPKPEEPIFLNGNEAKAKLALDQFTPGLFDFFAGGTEKKRKRLSDVLASAPKVDQAKFDSKMASHQKAVKEWESETGLARRLLLGEQDAIVEVVNEMQSLEEQALIGSAVSYLIDGNCVHAKLEVHSDEIVPNYRRKQLASGKLSQTKMPVAQFNELYQDYVCSVALKVAGDLFHILPLDEIYVTCQTTMLNSKTGHQELTAILSVQFVRATFAHLNLANIDPSDSMANFNHAMSFKKTKGLAAIEPLKRDP